jgi:hypothetical protein
MGGPLTLVAIRRGERKGPAEFAALLGISRTQLVDIECGRRTVTLGAQQVSLWCSNRVKHSS